MYAWKLAEFRAGQTIVDLGCGPGFTSLDLTAVVGETGRVIAIDSSPHATGYLRTSAAERRIANLDVMTSTAQDVDFSTWVPDAVFARWLFCFLSDPAALIRRIAQGLTSGSTIAVMDYWNYSAIQIQPGSDLFRKVFRAVYRSFADAGGSLDVAGQLPALLSSAGFQVTHTVPLCHVGQPGSPIWNWIDEFQALYLPTLVEKRYLAMKELDLYSAWWQEQSRNGVSMIFAPPVLSISAIKR
jgi:trans-aconitate methyltransferase